MKKQNQEMIIYYLEKKINPETGEIKLINKETGKEIKNIKIKKDPITGKEVFISTNKLEIKDELLNNNLSQKSNYTTQETNISKNEKSKRENLLTNSNLINNYPIEFSYVKDPKTNKKILVNKETGESNFEIKTDVNNNPYLVNKKTGEIIKDIIKEIDPKTNEETYIINNPTLNNLIKEKNNELNTTELISIKDPKTKKDIIINKQTGEKIDNLIIRKNSLTGESEIINSENGEKINNIILSKDPITGEETFIKINPINENNNINYKITDIEIKKDPKTNKEILINKETGLPIMNIEKKKDPETGKTYFINKKNGETINNIIPSLNENGNEVFKKIDIIQPISRNKNNDKMIIKKDEKTGKDIIINTETGEKINNIEVKVDKKTGETILINKETNEKLRDVLMRKDPITGNEIITFGDDYEYESDKDYENNQLITINDPITNEEILIDKNTGKNKIIYK